MRIYIYSMFVFTLRSMPLYRFVCLCNIYSNGCVWLLSMCVGHQAALSNLISAACIVFFIRPASNVFTSQRHQSSSLLRGHVCMGDVHIYNVKVYACASPSTQFDPFALIVNITTGVIILAFAFAFVDHQFQAVALVAEEGDNIVIFLPFPFINVIMLASNGIKMFALTHLFAQSSCSLPLLHDGNCKKNYRSVENFHFIPFQFI